MVGTGSRALGVQRQLASQAHLSVNVGEVIGSCVDSKSFYLQKMSPLAFPRVAFSGLICLSVCMTSLSASALWSRALAAELKPNANYQFSEVPGPGSRSFCSS